MEDGVWDIGGEEEEKRPEVPPSPPPPPPPPPVPGAAAVPPPPVEDADAEPEDACLYRDRSFDGGYDWSEVQVRETRQLNVDLLSVLAVVTKISQPTQRAHWDKAAMARVLEQYRDWIMHRYLFFARRMRMSGQRPECVTVQNELRFIDFSGFMRLTPAAVYATLACCISYINDCHHVRVRADDRAHCTDLRTRLQEHVDTWKKCLIAGVVMYTDHAKPSERKVVCWTDWKRDAIRSLRTAEVLAGELFVSCIHRQVAVPIDTLSTIGPPVTGAMAEKNKQDTDFWDACHQLAEDMARAQFLLELQTQYVLQLKLRPFNHRDVARRTDVMNRIGTILVSKPDASVLKRFRVFLYEHCLTLCTRTDHAQHHPMEAGDSRPVEVFQETLSETVRRQVKEWTQSLSQDVREAYRDRRHPVHDLFLTFTLMNWFEVEQRVAWTERFYVSNFRFPELHYILTSDRDADGHVEQKRAPIVTTLLGKWVVVCSDQTGYVCESGVDAVMAWALEMLYEFRGKDSYGTVWLDMLEKLMPGEYASFADEEEKKRQRRIVRKRRRHEEQKRAPPHERRRLGIQYAAPSDVDSDLDDDSDEEGKDHPRPPASGSASARAPAPPPPPPALPDELAERNLVRLRELEESRRELGAVATVSRPADGDRVAVRVPLGVWIPPRKFIVRKTVYT